MLTIGFVSTAKYFMMNLIAEFRQHHQGVDVQLALGNRDQLVTMLQDSEVDIAVMGRPPRELALIADWEKKIDVLSRAIVGHDIRTIAGTPSWVLLFFERLFAAHLRQAASRRATGAGK